jgi:hypothetical protein
MRNWFLFVLPIFCNSTFGQVTEELIYPVVPIADECHYAFDNNDSIQVISMADFQKIDSIWTTFNTCIDYEESRQNAASFTIKFKPLGNENGPNFLVHDGYLKTEYQSSLVYNIKNLQPYEHIFFADIQYERGGAMYQVPDVHMVIDSLVILELDTCWQYFPMDPAGPMEPINITKESFIRILTDSFGYNRCESKVQWLDTSVKVNMWIAPRSLDYHYSINSFINDYTINDSSDLSRPIQEVKALNYADIIALRRSIYQKNNKYYYASEYRFNITDPPICESTFSLINPDLDSLTSLFSNVQKGEIETVPCFVNENGNPLSFSLVLEPKIGSASSSGSSDGTVSPNIITLLQKLHSGDTIFIGDLQNTNPYENKKSNYKSIVITLP